MVTGALQEYLWYLFICVWRQGKCFIAGLCLTLYTGLQVKLWWRVHVMGEPAEPVIPSGYLTLIPLNGAHWQSALLWLC